MLSKSLPVALLVVAWTGVEDVVAEPLPPPVVAVEFVVVPFAPDYKLD